MWGWKSKGSVVGCADMNGRRVHDVIWALKQSFTSCNPYYCHYNIRKTHDLSASSAATGLLLCTMAMWHSSTDTNISPVTARYSICYLQTPTTSGLLNLFRQVFYPPKILVGNTFNAQGPLKLPDCFDLAGQKNLLTFLMGPIGK